MLKNHFACQSKEFLNSQNFLPSKNVIFQKTGCLKKQKKSVFIATLGSILDSQLSWESGKFQLARWSHEVVIFSVRTVRPAGRPPDGHPTIWMLDWLGSWNLLAVLFLEPHPNCSPHQKSMCGSILQDGA